MLIQDLAFTEAWQICEPPQFTAPTTVLFQKLWRRMSKNVPERGLRKTNCWFSYDDFDLRPNCKFTNAVFRSDVKNRRTRKVYCQSKCNWMSIVFKIIQENAIPVSTIKLSNPNTSHFSAGWEISSKSVLVLMYRGYYCELPCHHRLLHFVQ